MVEAEQVFEKVLDDTVTLIVFKPTVVYILFKLSPVGSDTGIKVGFGLLLSVNVQVFTQVGQGTEEVTVHVVLVLYLRLGHRPD